MDPNGSGVSRDTPGLLMSTGYLFLCEKLISQMAAIQNMPELAEQYKDFASETREAFNRAYWREDVGGYAANNQACNAFALYLGIPDEEQAERAVANLVADVRDNGHHLTTGNLCTKYVLDVLTAYGYVDDAWKIVTQTTYPSWGFMLSKGATTVWERWEYLTGDAMNSHNHPMMASVDAWFYRYLLGIEPQAEHPGFEVFSLKPYPPTGLAWAEGSLETVKGTVRSAWKRSGRNFSWVVDIPINTKAVISVPAANAAGVTVDGKRLRAVQEGGFATFTLDGGHYEIKSKL
jgi:alpha-L-rhamnosidase